MTVPVDDSEDKSNKKAKDAQRASSKFVRVPVDEGIINAEFYFPGKPAISVLRCTMG